MTCDGCIYYTDSATRARGNLVYYPNIFTIPPFGGSSRAFSAEAVHPETAHEKERIRPHGKRFDERHLPRLQEDQRRDQGRSGRAPREIHHAHGRPPHGPSAHGPLLRHHPRARRLAERRRHHPHHHRRLPGHHRPRHHGQHRRQRAQHGHRLSGLRHRSGEDHHLHPLRRARPKPAHAPLPVARHRIRAHAQPHGEGRAGGLGPRAHGAAPQLPGAPGLRHPLLQGQRRARRQRPTAPHRADPPDPPPLQRALRAGVPGAPRASHRRRGNPRPRRAQDVEELRQRHRPFGHGRGDRQAHQEVADRLRAHDHLR